MARTLPRWARWTIGVGGTGVLLVVVLSIVSAIAAQRTLDDMFGLRSMRAFSDMNLIAVMVKANAELHGGKYPDRLDVLASPDERGRVSLNQESLIYGDAPTTTSRQRTSTRRFSCGAWVATACPAVKAKTGTRASEERRGDDAAFPSVRARRSSPAFSFQMRVTKLTSRRP